MTRRTGWGRTWPLAAALAALTMPPASPAQAPPGASKAAAPAEANPNRVRVPITTVDGLELDGTFFRSPTAGRDTACVLLVHRYGENRSKSELVALASDLQEAGF